MLIGKPSTSSNSIDNENNLIKEPEFKEIIPTGLPPCRRSLRETFKSGHSRDTEPFVDLQYCDTKKSELTTSQYPGNYNLYIVSN